MPGPFREFPNPDLAVEIDISPSQIDRPGIYQALRVGEVWRFDGDTVVIEQLGPDGAYVATESSRFLPIRAEEVVRWVVEEDTDDLPAWQTRAGSVDLAPRLVKPELIRAWVLQKLARRNKARQPEH